MSRAKSQLEYMKLVAQQLAKLQTDFVFTGGVVVATEGFLGSSKIKILPIFYFAGKHSGSDRNVGEEWYKDEIDC